MASGHVNRVKRPNTWLHRPMLQNVKKALANPEPSTHDSSRTFALSALERTRNSVTQSQLSIFAQEAMAESRVGR